MRAWAQQAPITLLPKITLLIILCNNLTHLLYVISYEYLLNFNVLLVVTGTDWAMFVDQCIMNSASQRLYLLYRFHSCISPLPRQEGPWRWPYLFTSRGLSSTKHHTWQTQDILHFSFHPVSAGETAHFNFRQKSSPSSVFAPSANCGIVTPLLSCDKRASKMQSSSFLCVFVWEGVWVLGCVISCVWTLGVCLREITVINCLYSDCTNGLHTDCAGRPSCHWAGDVYFWKFLESV